MELTAKPVGDDLWVITCNGKTVSHPMSYEEAYSIVWKIGRAATGRPF
jgi:hypothetical protein